MKTLDLHQNALTTIPARLLAFRHKLATRKAVQLHLPFSFGAETARSIKSYVVDALNEGLKQNLLGAEIDMEFLILSIRTYTKALINFTTHSNTDQLSN